MSGLQSLGWISPLVAQLLVLICAVDAVENRELGSDHVREVSDFNETHVVSNQELVVIYKPSQPVVVVPPAQSANSSNGNHISPKSDQSSSRSWETFEMWRNLLRSHSFEEVLQEVEMRHVDWRGFWMVRMYITHLHLRKAVLVVVFSAVLHLVNRLRTNELKSWILTF
jgi:hypothetical protein